MKTAAPAPSPTAGFATELRRSTPRTARRAEVYEEQFGTVEGAELVLDVGAGDSPWGVRRPGEGPVVVRCDPLYALDRPGDPDWAVAGAGQHLPFADDRFDRVVCSWATPHVPRDDLPRFLQELVRVTKPGGTVSVHPLYHVARHLVSAHDFVYEKKFAKQRPGTTLMIVKRPGVSEDEWAAIAAEIADSAKFHLGRTLHALRSLAQRRAIRSAGHNQLQPSIFSHLGPSRSHPAP